MVERMTHEQYVVMVRQHILDAAKDILDNNVDITAACHFIWQCWHEAELSLDTIEYRFITGLDDELEPFNPDKRNMYQLSNSIDNEEQSVLNYHKEAIFDWCKRVIRFLDNHDKT